MSTNFEYEETHNVKIEEVQPLEKRINVVFQVIERNEEREITNRSGETHRVCDFTVADETGSITLTLWNEDIDNITENETYKLSNGFVNVFHNSLRLSKGKFGTITADSTVFDEVNEENNRSSEHVEDPRRRSYGGGRSYNRGNRGYGGRQSYGRYDNRRRDRRDSRKRDRW